MSLLACSIRNIGRHIVKPFAVVGAGTPILSRLNPILSIITARLAPVGSVLYEQIYIEGVKCERTTPASPTNTVIVYFHGGGFFFGSPKGHRPITTRLALQTRATVISVDYTLGTYGPAEIEAEKVVRKVLEDNSSVVIAGDSAGGNLAVHCGHIFGGQVKAVAAISPWLDLRRQKLTFKDPIISTSAINTAARQYLKTTPPIRACKYRCKGTNLHNTKVILHYCDDEILAKGIRMLVSNLQDKAARPIVREYKGLFHVFQILGGILPEANKAMRDLSADILNAIND